MVRVPVLDGVPVLLDDVDAVSDDVCVVVSVPVPEGTYQSVLTGASATPRNTVPDAATARVVYAAVTVE